MDLRPRILLCRIIRFAHFFDLLLPPLRSFLCLRTLLFFTGKGGTPGAAALGLEMELQFDVLGGDMEHAYSVESEQRATTSVLVFEDAVAAGQDHV